MSAVLAPLVRLWDRHPPPDIDGRWVVPPGARAFALAGLPARSDGPLLVIAPSERDAEDLADDVALFCDDVTLMPAWETLPFEHRSPNAATMARRSMARHRLATGEAGTVVVASVRAVVQRVSPSDPAPIWLVTGHEIDVIHLADRLTVAGYDRTDRVESRGEFAIRGGIVDVFPAQAGEPVRIDFWGDTVEEIRVFSVGDQRSQEAVDSVEIYPAREFRSDREVAFAADRLVSEEPWNASVWERIAQYQQFAGLESWMSWLAPAHSLLDVVSGVEVVVIDPTRTADRARDLRKEEGDLAEALAPTWGHGAPARRVPRIHIPPHRQSVLGMTGAGVLGSVGRSTFGGADGRIGRHRRPVGRRGGLGNEAVSYRTKSAICKLHPAVPQRRGGSSVRPRSGILQNAGRKFQEFRGTYQADSVSTG